jgi:uncharacterized repeat protein (TIGR02543 family)
VSNSSFEDHELIAKPKGGDLVEAKFPGWDSEHCTVIVSRDSSSMERKGKYYNPDLVSPHRGKYSAVVGFSPRLKDPPVKEVMGALSTSIYVPDKSRLTISFWVHIQPGASLRVKVMDPFGNIIEERVYQEPTTWDNKIINLDHTHAGQKIFLKFFGRGIYEETIEYRRVIEFIIDPWTGLLIPFETVEPYKTGRWNFVFVDDVEVTSQIAIFEAQITSKGLPPDKKFAVDVTPPLPYGQENRILLKGGEMSRPIEFLIGKEYRLTMVEGFFQEERNTLYECYEKEILVSSPGTYTFEFQTYYKLTVISEDPYCETRGSGWYPDGSTAQFGLTSTSIDPGGFLGVLGVRYRFKGWTGDAFTTSPTSELRMDAPKTVYAEWELNYTPLYVFITVLGSSGALAGVGYIYRRGGLRSVKWKLISRRILVSLVPVRNIVERLRIVFEDIFLKSVEEKDIREKISKLDRLKREKKIGDEAYARMREELKVRLEAVRMKRRKSAGAVKLPSDEE